MEEYAESQVRQFVVPTSYHPEVTMVPVRVQYPHWSVWVAIGSPHDGQVHVWDTTLKRHVPWAEMTQAPNSIFRVNHDGAGHWQVHDIYVSRGNQVTHWTLDYISRLELVRQLGLSPPTVVAPTQSYQHLVPLINDRPTA